MKTFTYVLVIFTINMNFLFGQNFETAEEAFQNPNQDVQEFKNYDLFSSDSQTVPQNLREISTDASFLEVNLGVLAEIQQDEPEFIRFQVQYQNEILWVKMQRQRILTDDFIVRNENDEELTYTPGIYYKGLVNEDRKSLAVFNLFTESVNGVISQPNGGNKIIGQLKDKSNYVIYDDSKMTVKQDFVCEVNDFDQIAELIPQSDISNITNLSANCVRVFYELTNDVFTANSSSVNDTMNWMTSVHNLVASLYSDSSIPSALSDVLIWEQSDPYTGGNSDKLNFFRVNRTTFNGDLAHLIDFPATGGVAYLNSICEDYRHAFSGASVFYNQLPTYSWTVNVVAHEMGHSLGSPHTHACFWNSNSTAIDSCGPNNGYSEGCDNGPIPSAGGTVLSYCHLDSTGVNLAQGFHPQVGSYMSSNIDTKFCLGTDCINSCMKTIAGVSVTQTDETSFTINIDDVISTSWDYRVFEQNTFPSGFITTTNNTVVYDNVQPNTFYTIQVINNCTTGSFGGPFQVIYLSDTDWCSTQTFTDTGGLSGDYSNKEILIKTFYPDVSGNAIALNINNLDLETGYDFMVLYDGESTNDPVFADGVLNGTNPPTTFFQATNPAGAITVQFRSDGAVTNTGWDITVSCISLSNTEFAQDDITIYPNPFRNELSIKSEIPLRKFVVYDINGKVMLEKELNRESTINTNLEQLASGLYLIKLFSEESTLIKRIIKN